MKLFSLKKLPINVPLMELLLNLHPIRDKTKKSYYLK